MLILDIYSRSHPDPPNMQLCLSTGSYMACMNLMICINLHVPVVFVVPLKQHKHMHEFIIIFNLLSTLASHYVTQFLTAVSLIFSLAWCSRNGVIFTFNLSCTDKI